MNKNRALAALGVASVVLVLAGCPQKTFAPEALCDQHQRQFCNGNHCDLQVTVSSCNAISVAQSDLHLCKRDGPKTINWQLSPGGNFKFRDDGIDFKNLPNTEDFDPSTKQKGPFKYSWTDKLQNGGGRTFDYSIKLVDSSGRHCDIDPRISND